MSSEVSDQLDEDGRRGRAPGARKPGAQPGGDGHLTSRTLSNPICFGGEDWLTLSLYLSHQDFGHVSELLDTRRNAAEERRTGEDELALAGQEFLVLPAGAKVGAKRSKAYFRWQLQSESGYTLQLMNRPSCKGNMPNGKLVAPSMSLMRLGLEGVIQQAFGAIESLGARVDRNKVSRIDVCCDLPGHRIEPLKSAFLAGHVVSRARASDVHGEEVSWIDSDYSIYSLNREATSFNMGRGNVRLRVYEKIRECKHDVEKLQVLVGRRWGGFPFLAIRAEFQLRREKLKQLGVDSLADWLEKRAAIVHYLTEHWFRLTDGPVDRKHPGRTPTLGEWITVQEAFASWAGSGPFPKLEAIPSQDLPPDLYVRSIIGLFKSYFARTGKPIDSNETFGHEGMCLVLDEIEERDMAAEVGRRALELGVPSRREEPC